MLVLLHIFGISYRSAKILLTNHEEYLTMIGLKEIPSFQAPSRRARMLDLHAINRGDHIPLFNGIHCCGGFFHDTHMQVFHCNEEKAMGQLHGSCIKMIIDHQRVVLWP